MKNLNEIYGFLSASYDVGIAKKLGISAAVLLNKLIYLSQYTQREDGYCWRKAEDLENELGIGRKALKGAIEKLKDAGIIDAKVTYIQGTLTRCTHFKILVEIGNSESAKGDNSEYGKGDISEENAKGDISICNSNNSNNSNNNNNNSEKSNFQQQKRFTKPTIEEIKQYCDERNNGIEAEAFFDFYESKGWKVGRNSMKNWKAAIRNWERQNKEKEKMANANNFKVKQYVDLYNSYINNENALFKLYQELHIDVSCIKQLLFIFTYRLNKEKASNALNYIEHFKNWLNTEAGQKAIKDIKLSI